MENTRSHYKQMKECNTAGLNTPTYVFRFQEKHFSLAAHVHCVQA